MDREEIIRDFDGWTWNIASKEIENYIYNIVYQNIKILLGEEFLQSNINNNLIDFIYEFERKIIEISNEELASNIYMLIYQIAILENIKEDREKQIELVQQRESLQEELGSMENKKEYLQKISNEKKVIGKYIKKIDEIINDNQLLRESFVLENSKLEEKIFSLSEYVEILQEKRESLLEKLEEYSCLMKPASYVEAKQELDKNVEILSKVDLEIDYNKEITSLVIKLEENVLKAFAEKIKKIETKKEILQCVYWMRYYKLLYINSKEQIKDISKLSSELSKTEKFLITKACKLKAINILCPDIERNYEIVSQILSYNIIDLDTVSLEFKKENNSIVLIIYDDNVVEDTVIYGEDEEINVKFNKKIRLFN